jgi:hypothetical protein
MPLGLMLAVAIMGLSGAETARSSNQGGAARITDQVARPAPDVRDVRAHQASENEGVAKPLFSHVRSTDGHIFALVQKGYMRSASFRVLVESIQRSNAIVMIQPGLCAGGRIRACLVGVEGTEQARHIRIKVDLRHGNEASLVGTIAHELQHAVEITERPEVTNASGLLRLYRSIAFGRCGKGLSDECETARALATERAVLLELDKTVDSK